MREYAEGLLTHPEEMGRIRQDLHGVALGCLCAGGPCHGMVMAAVANCQDGQFQNLIELARRAEQYDETTPASSAATFRVAPAGEPEPSDYDRARNSLG